MQHVCSRQVAEAGQEQWQFLEELPKRVLTCTFSFVIAFAAQRHS
jgi:hypothetical protein